MATLALAAVGAAVGGALLPTGLTLLGATIGGAALGSQLGALAGSVVDQALFGASGQSRNVTGPRLRELHVTASTEGAPIPRLYGRARLGGQLIWADEIEEEAVTTEVGGGKGGALGAGAEQTEYRYYASFAIGLAEGEIGGIGRVWADGREFDLSGVLYRLHNGSETQSADSSVVAREGADNAPAFRGLAYIVFERLPLAEFGNRLPQLSFEVFRPVDSFNDEVRGVVMIPGSGEFAYGTGPVTQEFGNGFSVAENVHTQNAGTDWSVALDQLEAALPNASSVSLVTSWFGTDLRASHCQLKPGVESTTKVTAPLTWQVAGVTRAHAYVVSQRDGRPAYGGTPSDASVVQAIADLKSRGHFVTLNPFILMDVAEGNALPSPYGGTSQPAYPWRGRITVHPAAGEPGSPDKTAAAATQVAAFVGSAAPADFAIAGGEVVYSGPAEWSYRRMILHHAWLAQAAGGVDAFLIGSEMRGLSWVRESASGYPFVAALIALAADVKSVLGSGTKVLYSADWSEYFGHQPADGSGDVYFHLDPLWASASIDAIGIDQYWPLADWRDGRAHLDFLAGARSSYDLAYLRSNVRGGEGFDWYYASEADRAAQVRTPITDGAGKPWVFRYKDMASWWANQHYNRPGGVEAVSPTAWVPQSKPFWLMEVGCPAVDKGANQPNVFVDPKSSENALPYFSRGLRDDLMQRRYVQALIRAFTPGSEGFVAAANPVSGVYGGRMIDTARTHVYCWDSRPYPAFPFSTDVWGDGENWRLGHWLTGRAASMPLAVVVEQVLADHGFDERDAGQLKGIVPGYVIDRVMSAREALQPLGLAYFFDGIETGGAIAFRHRGLEPAAIAVSEAQLVESDPEAALLTLTRGQETELPASAKVSYIGGAGDYRQVVAESRRLTGASGRISQAELPIVLDADQASALADAWLFESWSARERASFALPPSALRIEPGDAIEITRPAGAILVRVTETGEQGRREIEARAIDPGVYDGAPAPDRPAPPLPPVAIGRPLVELIDLPLLRSDWPPEAGYVAALQQPWPGGVALFGSPETTGYRLKAVATRAAIMGTTLLDLPSGPAARLDRGARLTVKVGGGALTSATLVQVLAGANVAAVRNADGEWEVLQYETATLIAPSTYELSSLLRGQGGTEAAMRSPVAAGAPFVVIDASVARVPLTLDEIRLPYSWRFGPSNRDIGHASYATRAHTFAGLGLKPLAPVHVHGTRSGGGDLTVTWVRRTRIGGDTWEAADVPLGEDAELYEIDVLDGAAVKLTLSATAPVATYTAAQQVADFGAPQPSCDLRLYQMSTVYGRGTARSATV